MQKNGDMKISLLSLDFLKSDPNREEWLQNKSLFTDHIHWKNSNIIFYLPIYLMEIYTHTISSNICVSYKWEYFSEGSITPCFKINKFK